MNNSKVTILNRQAQVLDYLIMNPHSEIEAIADKLGVSQSTVRRDLAQLIESNEVERCYPGTGYSVSKEHYALDNERYFSININEKRAIAKYAAYLINNGDTVFMNASSTALEMFKYINGHDISIITNGARSMLKELNRGVSLTMTGGEVQRASPDEPMFFMGGEHAVDMLSKVTATKCFLGVTGISYKYGLSSRNPYEPEINNAMIRQCRGPVIVIADHRKVGITQDYHFGCLEDVSILITDSRSDEKELRAISRLGIKVIIVDTKETLTGI